jgi:hypothetical protein
MAGSSAIVAVLDVYREVCAREAVRVERQHEGGQYDDD